MSEYENASEELVDLIQEVSLSATKNEATRMVDLLIEIIKEEAEEKADEAIGMHKEDYDHDLMYQ